MGGLGEVKWSACSPSTLTIRVWIPLKLSIVSKYFEEIKVNENEVGNGQLVKVFFNVPKIVVEKNENKQKEPRVG